jgi:hypothetical protein
LKLLSPISISSKDGNLANLYQLLVTVALDPLNFLPQSLDKRSKRLISKNTRGLLISIAGCAIATMIAYKVYKQQTAIHSM